MRSPKPSPAIDADCTAGTASLEWRAMRRLASVLTVALTTHACTSTQTADPPPSCSRIEASAKFALTGFDTMGKIADKCFDGTDIRMCNPAGVVVAPMASALVAPLLFVIGSMSDDVQRHQCLPGATPSKAYEETSADISVMRGVER